MSTLLALTFAVLLQARGFWFDVGAWLYSSLTNVENSCAWQMGNRPEAFGTFFTGFDYAPYFMDEYDEVRFPSRQPGLEIAGWYVPGAEGAPAVIVVDGLGGCKNAPAALLPAGMLHRAGFHVLLIDLRDTGDSDMEDGRTALGTEEYLDVLGAFDWLAGQGFAPDRIGVYGNSLGAAAALIAFAEEPDLAAAFAVAPFADTLEIIGDELGRLFLPRWLAPAAVDIALAVSGDDLAAHNPSDAVRGAAGRPLFVVHALDDRRIDPRHSRALVALAGSQGANLQAWFPATGGHVFIPQTHTQSFESRLTEFFTAALE